MSPGRAPGGVRTAKRLGAPRAGGGHGAPCNSLLFPCVFTSFHAKRISSPALWRQHLSSVNTGWVTQVPRRVPLRSIGSPYSAGQQTLQVNPLSCIQDRVTGRVRLACGLPRVHAVRGGCSSHHPAPLQAQRGVLPPT